jgi:ABC-type dipeptide/oligopeptide/nickel transport system permease component
MQTTLFNLIGRRLLGAIPSLFAVIVVTFVIMRLLPGDPAAFFAGAAATEEAVAQIRTQLGLDESIFTQFWIYLQALAQGDMGRSFTTGQPVTTDLLERMPASLELTLLGLLIAVVIGLPLGMLAATHPNSWVDHLCRLLTTSGVCLPTFFTGLVLIYIFYYLLGWAPAPMGRLDLFSSPPTDVTGFYLIDSALMGDWELFRAALAQLILPAISLALFALAPLARMTRAGLLGVLNSDFIRTARANGLSRQTILWRYALRNSLLPVVNTMGMVFSYLLGINVLVEKVFAWPGIGSYALEALMSSDYAPVQGFVLAIAVLYVLLNLTVDLTCSLIDPRMEAAQ